jgi:hypothetical protein
MTSRSRKRTLALIAFCTAVTSIGVIGSGAASARSTAAAATCPDANTTLQPRSAFPPDTSGTVSYIRNQQAVPRAVLCLVNAERADEAARRHIPIPPLHTWITLRGAPGGLRAAAALHALNAISHRWWLIKEDWPEGTTIPSPHDDPVTKSTIASRIADAGYCRGPHTWLQVAENVYAGSGEWSTAAKAVDWWMHSAGHRTNILDPNLKDTGIAVVVGNAHVRHEADTPAATFVETFGTCTR